MAASKGFLIIVLFALSAEFIACQIDDTYDGLFEVTTIASDDYDCEIFGTCGDTTAAARATSTTPRSTTTHVWGTTSKTTTTARTTTKKTTVPTPPRTVSEDEEWESPEVTALNLRVTKKNSIFVYLRNASCTRSASRTIFAATRRK